MAKNSNFVVQPPPAEAPATDTDRTFKPIVEDIIDETPFEEEELESIMNNISLIANVSQTEPDIEDVDQDVKQTSDHNESISAAFSYRP